MKKFVATLCILGSALSLAACASGDGNVETQAPYAQERTAGEGKVTKMEHTYNKAQQK
ncbi:MAG: hypothetical protein LRY62_02345 [Alphaproteobacteria bacterium]|nr:hypothetical protein [Alphaproteobacteria bacterium]